MSVLKKLLITCLCVCTVSTSVMAEPETASVTDTAATVETAAQYKTVNITHNGAHSVLSDYAHIVDGKVVLPIKELSYCMGIPTVEYYADSDCYILKNQLTTLVLYMNNPYTIVGDFGYYTSVAPTVIDGLAYVSLDVVSEAFGAELNIFESETAIDVTLDYIPPVAFITLNGKTKNLSSPGIVVDGKVMLPIEAMADMMRLQYAYYSDSNCYLLKEKRNSSSVAIYMNNPYTIANEYGYYTAVAPRFINGVAYVSADVVAQAFNADYSETASTSGYTVALDYDMYTPEEIFINDSGKSSQTSYLIWVSKKDFKVHVFYGSRGNWSLLKSFRCSIGAPSTPTCEGTYKFYERISKWDYGTYYVGPVMRFNGGYALHSTILNNNGTSRDGRLGKMISHGCVRLAPADINWMYYNIPLYTTVYVTR